MPTTLTPFTIAGTFGGEQDSRYALVTIGLPELEAILEIAPILKAFQEKHGGFTNLDHCAGQEIEFLESFPTGHGFGMALDEDPWDVDFPVILPGYAECKEAFFKAAADEKCVRGAEATGLHISLHGGVRIRGYEKHDETELMSEDILPLIIRHLESTCEIPSMAIVSRLRSIFPYPDC